MLKQDFGIGQTFHTATGAWRCTDIGTRVITAIKLDRADELNYSGPPYMIEEVVFDENDFGGCALEPFDGAGQG